MVRYGRACESGWLPVYSVETEDEAQRLLVMACQRGMNGDFVARELIGEQTLENLGAFSDRLDGLYRQYILKETNHDSAGGRGEEAAKAQTPEAPGAPVGL